jgi:predicted nucleic acid-binding protein
MSVFVDTGVLYAHHDIDASRHETGAKALTTVLKLAEYGRVLTSEYIYDEVLTLTYRRTGRMEDAMELGRRIRGDESYPDSIDLLHSSRTLFDEATGRFETYEDHGLSFTDVMTVILVEHHEIDSVLSFDDDFDGIIERLDPTTIPTRE